MTMRYYYKAFCRKILGENKIELVVDLGFGINFRVACLLYGVAARETRRSEKTAIECAKNLAARAWLAAQIEGKAVYVQTRLAGETYFATVWSEEIDKPSFVSSVNQKMIDTGVSRAV